MGFTPLNAREPDLDPRLLRASSRDVVLVPCLRAAIDRLKPAVPAAARKDAFRQVFDLGQPARLHALRGPGPEPTKLPPADKGDANKIFDFCARIFDAVTLSPFMGWDSVTP